MNDPALLSSDGSPATGACNVALDDVRSSITEVVRPTPVSSTVVVAGGAAAPASHVVVQPVAVRRVGRSHRSGPLLDLQLTLAVEVTGPDALDNLERVLVWAETTGMTVGEPPAGLGLTLLVPVSVPLEHPSAPVVTSTVVRLLPTGDLEGTVVDADGRAARGVAVSSTLTHQVVHTDATGRFHLVGARMPSTITASDGHRRASVDVVDGTGRIHIQLPATPEGD